MTEAVEERDGKNRPIAANPAIGQPRAEQRQEINRRRKEVDDLLSFHIPELQLLAQVDRQDGKHPVIAEALGGLIAVDERDTAWHPWRADARSGRCRFGHSLGQTLLALAQCLQELRRLARLRLLLEREGDFHHHRSAPSPPEKEKPDRKSKTPSARHRAVWIPRHCRWRRAAA